MKRHLRWTKRVVGLILAAGMLLAACGTGADSRTTEPENGIPLRICSIGGLDTGTVDRIGARLEELLEEKLGQQIDLELMTISRSNYNEQLNLMFLRGEAPDVFAIYQQTAFNNLAESGNLLVLNDWMEAYFPAGEDIPEALWSRTTQNGIVYGVPKYLKTGQYVSFVLEAGCAEEFGADTETLWTWEELHELLLRIKEKYPDSYPVLPHYGSVMTFLGQDSMGDNLGVLVDESSGSTTVENWYASESYYAFCKRMHQWYQEGLILPDAYDTQINIYSLIEAGLGYGGFFRSPTLRSKGEWKELRLSGYTADIWMDDVLWGVSSSCENLELAVQVLNCLYADPEVSMLTGYGEENIDYTMDAQRNMTLIVPEQSDQYWAGVTWAWPGTANLESCINNLDQFWGQIQSDEIVYSPAYGFAYDSSSVQMEVEQCQNIVKKYHKGLVCGFFDPDVVIPQFLQELEDAGIGTILAEKQRQLDIWLQGK